MSETVNSDINVGSKQTESTETHNSTSSHNQSSSVSAQENASSNTNQMERSLTKRHVQFIAIGGTIGTGLFLGSGT